MRGGTGNSCVNVFKRLSDNEFNISDFSGHGVGSATHAGKLVAQTILNQDSTGFDAMAKVPSIPFPGPPAQSPLLIMAMTRIHSEISLAIK